MATVMTWVQDIMPRLIAAPPQAVISVATDSPDPLGDLVRVLAPGAKVFSTGTSLDSLRFRVHLAPAFGVDARSVQADVRGEHGKSEVQHWSGVTIARRSGRRMCAHRPASASSPTKPKQGENP